MTTPSPISLSSKCAPLPESGAHIMAPTSGVAPPADGRVPSGLTAPKAAPGAQIPPPGAVARDDLTGLFLSHAQDIVCELNMLESRVKHNPLRFDYISVYRAKAVIQSALDAIPLDGLANTPLHHRGPLSEVRG